MKWPPASRELREHDAGERRRQPQNGTYDRQRPHALPKRVVVRCRKKRVLCSRQQVAICQEQRRRGPILTQNSMAPRNVVTSERNIRRPLTERERETAQNDAMHALPAREDADRARLDLRDSRPSVARSITNAAPAPEHERSDVQEDHGR